MHRVDGAWVAATVWHVWMHAHIRHHTIHLELFQMVRTIKGQNCFRKCLLTLKMSGLTIFGIKVTEVGGTDLSVNRKMALHCDIYLHVLEKCGKQCKHCQKNDKQLQWHHQWFFLTRQSEPFESRFFWQKFYFLKNVFLPWHYLPLPNPNPLINFSRSATPALPIGLQLVDDRKWPFTKTQTGRHAQPRRRSGKSRTFSRDAENARAIMRTQRGPVTLPATGSRRRVRTPWPHEGEFPGFMAEAHTCARAAGGKVLLTFAKTNTKTNNNQSQEHSV